MEVNQVDAKFASENNDDKHKEKPSVSSLNCYINGVIKALNVYIS